MVVLTKFLMIELRSMHFDLSINILQTLSKEIIIGIEYSSQLLVHSVNLKQIKKVRVKMQLTYLVLYPTG